MTEQSLDVAGLSAPAEIRIDRWGIPHLRAASLMDVFFLQGFNAARDRLWQIDLWRKRGLGLLAADFGPGYLAQDQAARLFLYRGDMSAEWRAYGPDSEAICTAFTSGINAYVELTEREPARLPAEFQFLKTRPARWQPADVVRIRTHALTRNAVSEILRANVLRATDLATDELRHNLNPPVVPMQAPGLDLGDIPLAALDLFKLATATVTFKPERLAAGLDDVKTWTKVTDLGEVIRATFEEGSNNWVVHGSRTATGRPILASDPHRTHTMPSLRYLVHLTAPGFDAIGTGEAAVPGISIGHNGKLAFGLTIFGTDQEDVYVYETHPEDRDLYRYSDGWEAIQRVEESFEVAGAPMQKAILSFTRHGPVLFEDARRHRAIALRSVWSEPGSAAYLGSLTAMRTESVAAFGASLAHWGTPSVNHVCADISGHIGWFVAGFAPLRANWDGLLPVPGDGRYEWNGFRPFDQLPREIDAGKGFSATANENNLPASWPADHHISHEWGDSSRAMRIHAVLESQPAHDVEASCRLQTDVRSLLAERAKRLFGQLDSEVDANTKLGRDLFTNWSCDLAADSAAAALFELWWTNHLKPKLMAMLVPDAATRALLVPGDAETILAALEAPDARFGSAPERQRDALLSATLGAAVADAKKRLGADPALWAWGKLHHGFFEHPLHSALPQEGRGDFDVGPLPMGGDRYVPMNSGYRVSDFRTITGASVRLVINVGDWDKSVCINAPGQSGDPTSPHYRDLAPLWARGDYVPLLYSRERVDEATETLISLAPL